MPRYDFTYFSLKPELTTYSEANSDVVLLRVFDDIKCFVLGDSGSKFRVPRSTPEHLKSIVLRSDTQFLTSTEHRWEVFWDDETGNNRTR